MNGETIVVALFAAGVPGFVAGYFTRRKSKADAADVITQAAGRVVTQLSTALDAAEATTDRLQDEMNDLRTRVEKEVAELRAEIRRLRALVVELGGDPTIGRRSSDRT